MSQLRIIGIVLIVIGMMAFSYQGIITFKTRDNVIDAGPIQVTTEKTHTVLVPPILGTLAFVGGIVLLVASPRRA